MKREWGRMGERDVPCLCSMHACTPASQCSAAGGGDKRGRQQGGSTHSNAQQWGRSKFRSKINGGKAPPPPACLPAQHRGEAGGAGGDGAQRGGCTQPAGARGSPAGGAYRPCVQKGRGGMSAAAALRRGCRGCCELLSSLLAGRLLTCSQQQAQRCRWGCPWLPSPRCQRPQTRPRRLQSGAAPPPRRLQAPAGRAW